MWRGICCGREWRRVPPSPDRASPPGAQSGGDNISNRSFHMLAILTSEDKTIKCKELSYVNCFVCKFGLLCTIWVVCLQAFIMPGSASACVWRNLLALKAMQLILIAWTHLWTLCKCLLANTGKQFCKCLQANQKKRHMKCKYWNSTLTTKPLV